jgi:hypothetical protein
MRVEKYFKNDIYVVSECVIPIISRCRLIRWDAWVIHKMKQHAPSFGVVCIYVSFCLVLYTCISWKKYIIATSNSMSNKYRLQKLNIYSQACGARHPPVDCCMLRRIEHIIINVLVMTKWCNYVITKRIKPIQSFWEINWSILIKRHCVMIRNWLFTRNHQY